jgi:hypothetical protein
MWFFYFLLSLLCFFRVSLATSPNATLPLEDEEIERIVSYTNEPSRLVIYVQTFKTPQGEPLSLLPLLQHQTKVNHIILTSMLLHEEPGEIRLNYDPFDSPTWDTIWEEVKTLQMNGVKVMGLLGGAAAGTFKHLNGTEKEVSLPKTGSPKFCAWN